MFTLPKDLQVAIVPNADSDEICSFIDSITKATPFIVIEPNPTNE
jgi:hypothetical protein